MAVYYKNKSIAEQNSLDLAWGLLVGIHNYPFAFSIRFLLSFLGSSNQRAFPPP